MTPFKDYAVRRKMIEIVGSSINKILADRSKEDVNLKNEDVRIGISMDVCDEIFRIIDNPTFKSGKKNDLRKV